MKVCTCEKFGCAQSIYRDANGIERMGVPLSDVTFRKHQRLAQLNVLLGSTSPGNRHPTPTPQDRPLLMPSEMAATGSQLPAHHSSAQNNQTIGSSSNQAAMSHITSQSGTDGRSGEENESRRNPMVAQDNELEAEFRFIDQHALHVLLQASRFHFEDYMSEEACKRFLANEKVKLSRLGNRFRFQTSIILKKIPASMVTVTRCLGLDCSFKNRPLARSVGRSTKEFRILKVGQNKNFTPR